MYTQVGALFDSLFTGGLPSAHDLSYCLGVCDEAEAARLAIGAAIGDDEAPRQSSHTLIQ